MVKKSLIRRDKFISHGGVEHILRYWQQIWVHRGLMGKLFSIDSRLDNLFKLFCRFLSVLFAHSLLDIGVDVIQKEGVSGIIFIAYLALRTGDTKEPVEIKPG